MFNTREETKGLDKGANGRQGRLELLITYGKKPFYVYPIAVLRMIVYKSEDEVDEHASMPLVSRDRSAG